MFSPSFGAVVGSEIRDPGWKKNQDPGSEMLFRIPDPEKLD
jgi:hypothetical protein